VENELVKETHYSFRVGRRTLPTTVKSTLPIRHMFGTFKPAVDSIPSQSESHGDGDSGIHTSNAGNISGLASHPYTVLWGILHVRQKSEEVDESYHGLRGYCSLDRRIERHLEQGRIHQKFACLDLRLAS
jgi:hypothetical protein